MQNRHAIRILILEEDQSDNHSLSRFLEQEGFTLEKITSWHDITTKILESQPEIVIFEQLLTSLDCKEIGKRVRPHFHNGIIMMANNKRTEEIALNSGIDDYLLNTTPHSIILARINALLRRILPPATPSEIKVQDLHIEYPKRKVSRFGEHLTISDSEFELLWILASQAGKVVNRDKLFLTLRGKPYDGLDRSIDMRVSKLRKKLQQDSQYEYIRTLRQLGYLFIQEG